MERIMKHTVVAVALLLAVGGAWAAQQVSETYPVAAGGEVDVEVLSGSVTVETWTQNLVEVTGTLGDGVESLDIDGDEDGVYIEVEYDEDYHGKQTVETNLTIRVPAGVELSIETVSASITVAGVKGGVDLESVSGNIQVTGMPAVLDVENVSGNISVESAPGESEISSVSGLITVGTAGGALSVENVSGKVTISGGFLDDTDIETVSGEIVCHAVPRAGADIDINSMSGAITLMVDAGLVASYELTTFSGTISNAIGPEPWRTSKYTPGTELHFNTGTGGARISLESFSGGIKLVTK
jgi:DUF4097 and DUF4098 domain-containing protein YvlB